MSGGIATRSESDSGVDRLSAPGTSSTRTGGSAVPRGSPGTTATGSGSAIGGRTQQQQQQQANGLPTGAASSRPKTTNLAGLGLSVSSPLTPPLNSELDNWNEQLRRMRDEEQQKMMQKIEEIRRAQDPRKHDQVFTLRKPEKLEQKGAGQ